MGAGGDREQLGQSLNHPQHQGFQPPHQTRPFLRFSKGGDPLQPEKPKSAAPSTRHTVRGRHRPHAPRAPGETEGVTIHAGHPFATPEPERSPLRRWRGRMAAPVSVWASGEGTGRAGWTLSSFLVADGEPAEALGLLDEDSALADQLRSGDPVRGAALVVNLLGWSHRGLADAFAGIAPAPGGPFTLGSWRQSDWGPCWRVRRAGWALAWSASPGRPAGVCWCEQWSSTSSSAPSRPTGCSATSGAATARSTCRGHARKFVGTCPARADVSRRSPRSR